MSLLGGVVIAVQWPQGSGTWAEWAAAAIALLALAAAVVAGWAAFKQAEHARAQAEAAEQQIALMLDERAAAQASQITAWLRVDRKAGFLPVLQNSSGLPIYRVNVKVSARPGVELSFPLDTVPPDRERITLHRIGMHLGALAQVNPAMYLSAAAPGYSGELDTALDVDGKPFVLHPIRISVTFSDVHGQRWERDYSGALHERDSDYGAAESVDKPDVEYLRWATGIRISGRKRKGIHDILDAARWHARHRVVRMLKEMGYEVPERISNGEAPTLVPYWLESPNSLEIPAMPPPSERWAYFKHRVRVSGLEKSIRVAFGKGQPATETQATYQTHAPTTDTTASSHAPQTQQDS